MKKLYSTLLLTLATIMPSWADGNVLVGSIDVNTTVTESGGAVVSIPIEVPYGINGMQPNLALVYNSQGGLGTAGWGWSLSGISSISRAGSNIYNDDKTSGITFTNQDNLTMNGQRLILRSGDNLTSGCIYHTEIETFNQVTYRPDYANTFVVLSKDGISTFYGNSDNYHLSYESDVLTWYPSEMRDNYGNSINYTYSVDNIYYAETHISSISYAGGGVSIIFTYDNLPHIRRSYYQRPSSNSPFVEQQSKLLRQIDIKSNDHLLYSYALTYDQTGTVPHLTSVQKFAANGDYLNPTNIAWNTSSLVTSYSTKTLYTGKKDNCVYDDFNGDGKIDILTYTKNNASAVLYINISSGTTVNYVAHTVTLAHEYDEIHTLDYNGDGMADIVGKYGTLASAHVGCELGTGTGFSTNYIWSADYTAAILTGDYDGNGMDDVLISDPQKIYRYNKTSITYSGIGVSLKDNYCFKKRRNLKVNLDFNGNGKTDVFVSTKDDAYVYELSDNGTTFTQIATFDYSSHGYSKCDKESFSFGDYNGDGRTDFIYYGKGLNTGDNFAAQYYVSNGHGFYGDGMIYRTIDVDHVKSLHSYDVNHDGLSDVVYILDDSSVPTAHICLSATNTNSDISITLTNLSSSSMGSYSHMELVDILGTGRAELTCFKTNTQLYSHRLFSANSNLVTSVTSTVGTDIHFTYLPLTDSSVYSSMGSYTFPYVEGKTPLYVVSTHTEPYVSENYSYRGLTIHQQGKGFIGFKERTVTDNINSIKSITSSQFITSTDAYMYPFQILVQKTDGSAIAQTVNTMSYRRYVGKNIFPYLSESTLIDNLTTLSETTEYTYDQNGNPTYITKTRGDLEENDYFIYTNAGSWCQNKVSFHRHNNVLGNESSQYIYNYYAYNDAGSLVSQTETSAYISDLVHSMGYDSFGNLTSDTLRGSGQTRITRNEYTSDGRYLRRTTDIYGMKVTYNHDDTTGLLTSQKDTTGFTTFVYDSFGRCTGTTYPDGTVETTTLSYDSQGYGIIYKTVETCTNKSPVTTWYNASGLPLCQKMIGFNDNSIFTSYGYYPDGSKKFVSEPFFGTTVGNALSRSYDNSNATVYTYDDYGRLVSEKSPSVDNHYTYNGLSATYITKKGTTRKQFNTIGWVEKVTLVDDGSHLLPDSLLLRSFNNESKAVQYSYYPTGKVHTITPDGGNTITLEYDGRGNRIKLTDPDAGIVEDEYNAFGQPILHTQAIHSETPVQTVYTYDSSTGLVLSETTTGDTIQTTTYNYNSRIKDLVQTIRNNSQNYMTQTYDEYGRPDVDARFMDGKTLYCRNYYIGQQLRHRAYLTTLSEYYQYDANGLLIKEKFNNSTDTWELLEANARGQIVREKKGGIITTYTYDNQGRILSEVAPGIVNLHYTYDEAGNVASKTDSISFQKAVYTYDNKNRLTSWKITKLPIPINPPRNLMSHPGFILLDSLYTISYDSQTGNIISKSDLGAESTFIYDHPSKPHALTSVSGISTEWGEEDLNIIYNDFSKVNNIHLGGKDYTIDYQPDGHRGKSLLTTPDGHTLSRYYGNQCETVQDSLGNYTRIAYLCHGAIIIMQGTTKTILQGYYDAQGSLIALADEDGNVVRRYAYDPWGKRVNPTNWMVDDTSNPDATFHINRGYTMHEHLDDFGLINMNGRVFDPAVAQFLSPDNHIQSSNNWLNYNRYAYCLNNPLIYVDEDGEFWHILAGAVIGGGGNLIFNWNNCDQFWEYLAVFAAGAAAGAITAACPNPFVSSLSMGGVSLVNNIVTQCDNNSTTVDWGEAIYAGIGGAAGGYASFYAGQFGTKISTKIGQALLSDGASKAIGNISSITGGAIGGFFGGFVGDCISTTGVECLHGNNLAGALRTGAKAGLRSGSYGAIQGAAVGYIKHVEKEYKLKKIADATKLTPSDIAASLSTLNDNFGTNNIPNIDFVPEYVSPQIPASPFLNSNSYSVPVDLDIERLWQNAGYLWYLK